ncbi:Alpha/beta hydrolase family protein [Corynebacterium capitovis DSM 44611]|nr:Alpha/beta hydrolase family protein [Corynebacterium capitovis DSM 44611]
MPRTTPGCMNNVGFSTYPHWFGSNDDLFACLDVPDVGATTSVVIIVAPFGEEKITTHRGLRYLSGQLATYGLASLRFDLPGTGSSFGSRTWDAWLISLSSALAHARSLSLTGVSLVTVGMGAFLVESWLAQARDDEVNAVERVVHWEPPATGKRWLREQQAKFVVAAGPAPDPNRVTALEFSPSAELAAQLSSLSWQKMPLRTGPERIIATQSDTATKPTLAPLCELASTTIRVRESDPFFSPPSLVHHVPYRDIAQLVDVLSACAGHKKGAHGLQASSPRLRNLARVTRFTSPEGELLEELIELATDRALLTFVTRSATEPPRAAVVFESTANEASWGPGRLWVDYARKEAGRGLEFVRHDKDNCGESGIIAPGSIPVLYSLQSRKDAVAVASWVADGLDTLPSGQRPILVAGLCSGAWMASEVAIALRAHSAVLVNLTQWSRSRRPVDKKFVRRHGLDPDTGKLTRAGDEATSWRARIKPAAVVIGRFIPLAVWKAGAIVGLVQNPGPMLRCLAGRGVSVDLVFSPVDFEHFLRHRGPETLGRVRRLKVRATALNAPAGDHSLHRPDSLEQTATLLDDAVQQLRRFSVRGAR